MTRVGGARIESAASIERRGLVFFVSLGLLQAMWPLTMDLYLPAFPLIESELATTPAAVQLSLTAAFIGMAVGQLVTGPISDAAGRMRPLAVALVVYVVATAGCALAPTIELFVAARLAQGLGAAGGAVIALAIVRDTSSGGAMLRTLANLAVINGFFVVFAPSAGAALLGLLDWRGLFVILVAYGLLLTLLFVTVFARVETNPRERRMLRGPSATRADYRVLATSGTFRGVVVGGGLIFAGMMAYMSSSAFLFQDVYGLTPSAYAIVFGGHGALMIVGAQIGARLSRRFPPERIVLIGVTGIVLSAVLLLASVTLMPDAGLVGFLVPLLCFTTAFGLTAPALQAFALGPHALRAGTAASFLGAANMVFAALVSPVAGLFGVATTVPTVCVMLACEVAALLVLGFVLLGARSRAAAAA